MACEWDHPSGNRDNSPRLRDVLGQNLELLRWLQQSVFAFCVPFDSSLDDGHDEHYYMEREWEELRYLFAWRRCIVLLLPKLYAPRFRSEPELSSYVGQITFSD